MRWLKLDPESIAARVRESGVPARIPTLAGSLARGIAGFTILSVAGFAPWALWGRPLVRIAGEAGMYAACALVFIALSGLLLHGLVAGPRTYWRFTALFGVAFAAYSAAWIVGWMTLRGHPGSLVGLLVGAAFMGWIIATAFGDRGAAPKSVAAIFILNTVGYYAGGWVEGKAAHLADLSLAGLALEKPPPAAVAMLLWGVCYGLGMGAGLGLAFYFSQKTVRERLRG